MNTMDVILKRRSIRKYTDQPIPEEALKAILQAGLLAPTSKNRKPCEFYVVHDASTLRQLALTKAAGADMLNHCNVAIAVFGDSRKADTWIEDCSIALSYMSLMATDQGIGNCWCQLHLRSDAEGNDAEANTRKVLNLTDDSLRIVGILALGLPAKEPVPHTPKDVDWSKVHQI